MLITPYLLLWGFPPAGAIGSAKIGSIGVIVASSRVFHKARMIDWALVKRLAVFVAIASIIGAKLAISTDPAILETLVGMGILLISISMLIFLRLGLGLEPRSSKQTHRIIGYGAYGLSTVAQATIGAGFGMANSIILISAFGQTALHALATKRLVNLAGLLAAGGVFIYNGDVNWALAGVLGIGYFLGAHIGTKFAVKKGNRFAMSVQVVLSAVMAAVLLLG